MKKFLLSITLSALVGCIPVTSELVRSGPELTFKSEFSTDLLVNCIKPILAVQGDVKPTREGKLTRLQALYPADDFTTADARAIFIIDIIDQGGFRQVDYYNGFRNGPFTEMRRRSVVQGVESCVQNGI